MEICKAVENILIIARDGQETHLNVGARLELNKIGLRELLESAPQLILQIIFILQLTINNGCVKYII